MTWTKISNKYKDIDLMEEFQWYRTPSAKVNIKDIWGHLICFAETKGYLFESETSYSIALQKEIGDGYKVLKRGITDDKTLEETMLWCVEKFFEVCK